MEDTLDKIAVFLTPHEWRSTVDALESMSPDDERLRVFRDEALCRLWESVGGSDHNRDSDCAPFIDRDTCTCLVCGVGHFRGVPKVRG